MTACKQDGKDYIYLSLSANIEDSKIEKYLLTEQTDSINEPLASLKIPEGSEQIETYNDNIIFLFESASIPYTATARIRNDQIWWMKGF